MKKGFTLIEVIIYIALFSLLIGTAFFTVYQLLEGSGRLSTKSTTQNEGNFVMRKLNWAMSGASNFSNTVNTLQINRYDSNQINVRLSGTKIEIRESAGSNVFTPLTTDNVTVSSLTFTSITGIPEGIIATATINGSTFTITKYIRK